MIDWIYFGGNLVIGYLKGIFTDLYEDIMILEVAGVGYEIKLSGSTIASLPHTGLEVKIYTYMAVREDNISLFGFSSKDELQFFKLLITVTGVGPKSAQCILSTLTADDLRFAIISGDAASIAKAPGIGKKGAERIILELKDKISIEEAISQKTFQGNSKETSFSSNKNEVIEALVALGYSPGEALKAINQVDASESLATEELLKASLKKIM